MNVLELFAGSRSIGKAAESLGYNVFSCDINEFNGIDYVGDILNFDPSKVPFTPDIIWASPPCTGFSVAAIGRNWDKSSGEPLPKTDTARMGLKILNKTWEIIDYYKSINPKLIYYIENPRGMMRKMPIMDKAFIRTTVTYCQYGDKRMKPTDIWHNNPWWTAKPACKNGDKCHEAAPRGSKTGTQGLKGNYERSKIPNELCLEVMLAAEDQIKANNP